MVSRRHPFGTCRRFMNSFPGSGPSLSPCFSASMAPTSKPTRLLSNLTAWKEQPPPFAKLPWFNSQHHYLGPLPKCCPHGGHEQALQGKDPLTNRWRTAPSASYPPQLCKFMARAIADTLQKFAGGGSKYSSPMSAGSSQEPQHAVLQASQASPRQQVVHQAVLQASQASQASPRQQVVHQASLDPQRAVLQASQASPQTGRQPPSQASSHASSPHQQSGHHALRDPQASPHAVCQPPSQASQPASPEPSLHLSQGSCSPPVCWDRNRVCSPR